MKILAIETSCDDTGIAILEANGGKNPDFRVLSNIVASQIEVHKQYGGVYPMMAKREHKKNLQPTLEAALKQAKITLKDINLIAVTNGPGLEPCLWVGVNFAKNLAKKWNIPLVPVNHIESHILVNFLNKYPCIHTHDRSDNCIKFPAICLVASGGHTQLILMKKIGKYKILGETRDDAAGECFDKTAKILGLGYPGGPIIAALAAKSEARFNSAELQRAKSSGSNSKSEIKLPRPMINTKDYDFSFSGLKTAVLYTVRDKKQVYTNSHDREKSCTLDYKYKQKMAAEIQQAIIDVLIKKTIKAAKDYKAKTIILGGGVSANAELRKQFTKELEKIMVKNFARAKNPTNAKIEFLVPPPDLSTDNAVMTAIAGYFHRSKKIATSDVAKLTANANLRISK